MSLYQLGVRTIIEKIRAGALTGEGYARALLERIAALEPKVHAWAWLDPEAALATARAADRAREAGSGAGVLHAIPVGIKDIMHVRGMPTGMGSAVFAGVMPEISATVVQRLESAGAFALGKTVTAELAYFHPGPTCNPWNAAHTPGGSSMGSAAAVACGMAPAALGTQTNGSVIRPAAFCGCVGYKPSQGLIPRAGILEFSATLDQVGVFARTVADAAGIASVLVGHDPQDAASIRGDAALAVELRQLAPLSRPARLAAVRSPVWPLAQAEQRARFEQDIRALRQAGAQVAEIELGPVFEQAHAMHRRIMYVEGARALGAMQAQHRARLSAMLNRLIDEGRLIAKAEYQEALAYRAALQRELQRFLTAYDAILTPPAQGEAPATLEHTGDPAFCTIWTLCGVPALTIPTGFGPRRLPLGLQVVGQMLDDVRTLEVAQWCAAAIAFDVGMHDS